MLNNKLNIKGFGETKIINSLSFPTIYLIGDSHSGHYGSVMRYLSEKKILILLCIPKEMALN